MEEITGLGMETAITLPSLANKSFTSMRNYETIYTNNEDYIKWFEEKT